MEAYVLEMLGVIRHTTTSAATNIVDSRRASAPVVSPFPFMHFIHCFIDFCMEPFLLLLVESLFCTTARVPSSRLMTMK
jgi:hypothetical protein